MKAAKTLELCVPEELIHAVQNQDRVDEPPHNFYKYPARFAPDFARQAIQAFTKPGETVLDPFCGSGTTIVEAMSAGRRAAGFDVSSLAAFISRTKTTSLSPRDKRQLTEWLAIVQAVRRPVAHLTKFENLDYYQRNLPANVQSFFTTILELLDLLPHDRQRRFVRLTLLTVGQWALDCRKPNLTWRELRSKLCEKLPLFIDGHDRFFSGVAESTGLPRCQIKSVRRIFNCSAEHGHQALPREWLPAKLILTSPPYPGVHVLYHRWQVNGRKETPAPFWLANGKDGAGEAHYCLGRRFENGLHTYFARLQVAFRSVAQLMGSQSLVVQLVAFSAPKWQLPRYLQAMEDAGLVEVRAKCACSYLRDGRIWRRVPGRRWYATQKGNGPAGSEVMLLHRLNPDRRAPVAILP